MKITPLSIKRQEFKRNIRGYDPDEVNTFLEIIADEFDQLQKQNEELSAQVTQLQKKLQDYQQIEKVYSKHCLRHKKHQPVQWKLQKSKQSC